MNFAAFVIRDVERARRNNWTLGEFNLMLTWNSPEERAEFLALLQGRAPTANQDRSR